MRLILCRRPLHLNPCMRDLTAYHGCLPAWFVPCTAFGSLLLWHSIGHRGGFLERKATAQKRTSVSAGRCVPPSQPSRGFLAPWPEGGALKDFQFVWGGLCGVVRPLCDWGCAGLCGPFGGQGPNLGPAWGPNRCQVCSQRKGRARFAWCSSLGCIIERN